MRIREKSGHDDVQFIEFKNNRPLKLRLIQHTKFSP